MNKISVKSINLDNDSLESIKYVSSEAWREMKQESVLVTERMYIKLLFKKKSELNLSGKIFLYRTVPIQIPKTMKLKEIKDLDSKKFKEHLKTATAQNSDYKYNTYIAMTEKKKIISFSLILHKDDALTSVCTEMARKDTDPAYAMRIKNILIGFLAVFVIVLIAKDADLIEMNLLEMNFWWIYALVFGIVWGMHRESLEAKCWYVALLRLNTYREPITFPKQNLKSSLKKLVPFIDKEKTVHIELDTNICLVWYSAETSPEKTLDLTLDELENQMMQIAFSVTSSTLQEFDYTKQKYETAKEQISTLRAELSKQKEKERLAIEMGKSLAAENFTINVSENGTGQNQSIAKTALSIDWGKIILAAIFGAVILGVMFFALQFILYVELDIFSKMLIVLGLLVVGLFLFLLIFKGRS